MKEEATSAQAKCRIFPPCVVRSARQVFHASHRAMQIILRDDKDPERKAASQSQGNYYLPQSIMKSPGREKRIENRNKVQQIPSHFPPILCMPEPIRAKSNEIETMVQEVLKRATNENKKTRLITNSLVGEPRKTSRPYVFYVEPERVKPREI